MLDRSRLPVSVPTTGVTEFLCSTSAFRGVDAADLRALACDFTPLTLRDGEVLVPQGDSNRSLYLVMSGGLRVIGETPGTGSRVLFHVQPGETVCEMGLLSDDPASATVEALGETSVVVLHRDDFDRFSADHPEAALQVVESLSRRLQIHRLSIAIHLGQLFDSPDPDVLRDLESE